MFKSIRDIAVGVLVGAIVAGGGAYASTAKPSGYCSKKEIGQTRQYTTPSGKSTYNLTCTVVPTQKWKK